MRVRASSGRVPSFALAALALAGGWLGAAVAPAARSRDMAGRRNDERGRRLDGARSADMARAALPLGRERRGGWRAAPTGSLARR